jgi:hypothetical protein
MITEEKTKKEHLIKRSYFRKHFGGIFASVLLVFLVVGAYFFWQLLQKPVSGKIQNATTPVALSKAEIFERFEGNYFSFRHSQAYATVSQKKDFPIGSIILESALFSDRVTSNKIAITVENRPGIRMQDSGSYVLRKKYPKIYQEKEIEVENFSGIVFVSNKDGLFEKTFFLPKNDYLAILSFTSPAAPDTDSEKETKDIIESIQWKK